jgi:hypothetical protein
MPLSPGVANDLWCADLKGEFKRRRAARKVRLRVDFLLYSGEPEASCIVEGGRRRGDGLAV